MIEPPEIVRGPMRRPGAGHVENEPFRLAGADVHAAIPSSAAAPAQVHMAQSAPELDPMWFPAPASANPERDGSQVQENGGASLGDVRTDEQLRGFPQGAAAVAVGAVQQTPLYQGRSLGASPSQQRSWQPGPTKALRDASLRRPAQRKQNLGFLVAGLCVMTGGLILFFVYFMALGAPGNSNESSMVKTTVAANALPTRGPSPASSPTATPFPGQKYIDHAQLASSIDPASHQPIQLATTFKTNQDIYVTFQVHTGGQSGAVCLLWYANNKMFTQPYALPVYPNEQTAYSYATYIGTGSGYVELYWASTTQCTDKVLAQRVNFTVTG